MKRRAAPPYVPVESGAKETSTHLVTTSRLGRRKQKVVRMKIEVVIDYPLDMPPDLCFQYAKDVERRVVNYATSCAKREAQEHRQ